MPIDEKFTAFDYALSHLVVNTKLFYQNFMLRFGYNTCAGMNWALQCERISGIQLGFWNKNK